MIEKVDFKYQLRLQYSYYHGNCTCFTNSLALGHSEIAASHHHEKLCGWLDKISLTRKNGWNSVLTKKEKVKKNCSLYLFSKLGAVYHGGYNLHDTSGRQYQTLLMYQRSSFYLLCLPALMLSYPI